MSKKTVVCESVGFGHPDKVADQVSDALLDAFLVQDLQTKAGIEVMIKDNIVVLGGEVNSRAKIDFDSVVRGVFANIPYPANHHLSPNEIKIINLIGKQSPEINNGVVQGDGTVFAGDQGFVTGFASNETEDYMPLGMHIAKKICQYVANQTSKGFGPDCKSQVIVVYDEKCCAHIDSILVSTMQQGDLTEDRKIIKTMIRENRMGLSDSIFAKYFCYTEKETQIVVNPCGEWRIGGSVSDCAVTGRKLCVDQYGGYCSIGGGNLGGKDMSKIDRSAAYMCRYIAKNIVAAGLADMAKVELSYMIGMPKPSSIYIELNRNKERTDDIVQWFEKHIDLSVFGIIKRFNGGYPRYYNLSLNGHFGKTDEEMKDEQTALNYPWEKTDIAVELNDFLNTKR